MQKLNNYGSNVEKLLIATSFFYRSLTCYRRKIHLLRHDMSSVKEICLKYFPSVGCENDGVRIKVF